MQVGYQHANPENGRESFLVRFHDEIRERTTCVLVDAGDSVDVDDLLKDDEYLSAILLSHAHLDHYRTLGANLRDSAPIYATCETVRAITSRLDTDADHVELENGDEIRAAFEPISGWTTITSDVRVHPVPAGHAPGACGFVLEFADGDERHRLLATGDFTTRRAAGYPGLPTDLPVDAVFLTAATSADSRTQLTNAVTTIAKRTTAGSTVLATASGLTGVHLAYLLAHLGERTGSPVPVTLAGRVATLWEAFEYDRPTVESVRTFDAPSEVLTPGRVTIAGPEVPVAGSSKRLFERIQDDAGATLVQVTSGAFNPRQSAGCMVVEYEFSNHPTESTIDEVIGELEPIHVIVTHQRGRAADRYKDKYDSFVWATDDRRRYTLYDDGRWSGPPWVRDATRRRVRSKQQMVNGGQIGSAFDTTDLPLPSVDRRDAVNLDAEGIDTDHLGERNSIDTGNREAAPVGESSDETAKYGVAVTEGASIQASGENGTSADSGTGTDSGSGTDCEGDPVAADADVDVDADSWRQIRDRLDRIEATIGGTSTRATVVDAGEGVTLLRLFDEPLDAEFKHGQTVSLTLHGTPDSDDCGAGNPETDSPTDSE